MNWKLNLGANIQEDGSVKFRVWAPNATSLSLMLYRKDGLQRLPMHPDDSKYFSFIVEDPLPEEYYRYCFPDGHEYSDPAYRYLPMGVTGPSMVWDPTQFSWSDSKWKGLPLHAYIFYECHVGTFTPEGTFAALEKKVPYLQRLGITCLEIMPIAQFSGQWNWGYDGVFPYAPQNTYGTPDDLKSLVDCCHNHGIAVALDVVYNHFGPEGYILDAFGPYTTDRYQTDWGKTVNYDDNLCAFVRHYIIANALHWISEYHIDCLRLDAIHGIFDSGPRHILEELLAEVQDLALDLGRYVHVVAESDLNDPKIVKGPHEGGFGLDAQWNDDFHHSMHVALTGERVGYYQDFVGLSDIARAMEEGFVYTGQYSPFRGKRHGSLSNDIPQQRWIVFAQNHDQIGNRGCGDRLTEMLSFEAQKLAAVFTLLNPSLPLLFMGEEYGERAPFHFFYDFSSATLTKQVGEGRRETCCKLGFPACVIPEGREAFYASRLRWETGSPQLFALYQKLIELRHINSAWHNAGVCEVKYSELSQQLWWALHVKGNGSVMVVCSLAEQELPFVFPLGSHLLLSTEEEAYGGKGASLPPLVLPPMSAWVVSY